MGSDFAHGETATVRNHSSESTRTRETNISDRRVSLPKPTREEEPFQPSGSLLDGYIASEAQAHVDAAILAICPNAEKSQAAADSDDSVARVNSSIEDVTRRHDTDVFQSAELNASFLEHSSPVESQSHVAGECL